MEEIIKQYNKTSWLFNQASEDNYVIDEMLQEKTTVAAINKAIDYLFNKCEVKPTLYLVEMNAKGHYALFGMENKRIIITFTKYTLLYAKLKQIKKEMYGGK